MSIFCGSHSLARRVTALLLAMLGLLFSGCGKGGDPTLPSENILVSVGDSTLTLERVVAMIPPGLSASDSISLYQSIVEGWVRNMVLADIGERTLPDMEEIDRMVDNYRSELILERYLATSEGNGERVSERELREYYDRHGDELRLESPLVKGILLKVDDGEADLENLRRWMSRAGTRDVDRIERHGLKNATQYEYFMNRWMDWERVAAQIPYRFFDAQAFVESTKDFETSYGGSTYLLHISEYVGVGEKMPYDYACDRIRRILGTSRRRADRTLTLRRLYKKAEEEGIMKAGLYDPMTGKTKEPAKEGRVEKEKH